MLSEQEIYERAVRGLDGQGWKRSLDEGGACMYRGDGGLKCAVGHLVDDVTAEVWDRFDDEGVSSSVESLPDSALAAAGLPPASRKLLDAMQGGHDSSNGPEDMRIRMHALAERFDVTWPADVKLPEVL